MKGPKSPLSSECFTTDAEGLMVTVYVHPFDLWVSASEQSMGEAIRSTTKRARSRPRLVIESSGTFAVVECVCPVPHNVHLFFKSDSFHMPESIADLEIKCGLVVGQFLQVLPICKCMCWCLLFPTCACHA